MKNPCALCAEPGLNLRKKCLILVPLSALPLPLAMSRMPKMVVGAAGLALAPVAFIAPSSTVHPESRVVPQTSQSAQLGTSAAAAGAPVAAALGASVAMLATRRASRAKQAKQAKLPRKADDAYGASHTSFYTDAVAKDKYDTLEEVLSLKLKDEKLKGMVNELLDACVKITEALRVNLVTVNDASNAFGDRQLTVDVIADNLLWDLAKTSKFVYEASSEEEPEIVQTNNDGQYVLCWDPLDGSSIEWKHSFETECASRSRVSFLSSGLKCSLRLQASSSKSRSAFS